MLKGYCIYWIFQYSLQGSKLKYTGVNLKTGRGRLFRPVYKHGKIAFVFVELLKQGSVHLESIFVSSELSQFVELLCHLDDPLPDLQDHPRLVLVLGARNVLVPGLGQVPETANIEVFCDIQFFVFLTCSP